MQLNAQEVRSVLILGAGGLATAMLYQLGSIFLRQSSDEVKLDPPTEALQHHGELLHIFHQLAEHRKYNEPAYRWAVISADDLALRLKQINGKVIKTNLDDVHEAFTFFQDTIKRIKKLQASALKAGNPRAAAEIHILLQKLYPELQQCYSGVQRSLRGH